MGVAPESVIKFPKVNKTKEDDDELSSGHTHLFLMNHEGDITDEEEEEAKENDLVYLSFGN